MNATTPPRRAGHGRHRDAIVEAAATLFRRQGYAATGLADILALAGAPRGSLYHYFPEGKAAIGTAAVERAGGLVAATLSALVRDQRNAADAVAAYGILLAGWMAGSDWRDGCPVTTVLLEITPDLPGPTAAGARVLGEWVGILAEALVRDGVEAGRAMRLARLAIAAIQGALVHARVSRDAGPILETTGEIAAVLRAATPDLSR